MNPRIIIVTPDFNLSTLIEARLSIESYDTDIAEDGETGLALIREKKPEVVILDAKLPRISARKFVETLRESPATEKTPIIIMSDRKDFQYLFEGTAIFAFITKPIIPSELMTQVQKAVKLFEKPQISPDQEVIVTKGKTIVLAGTQVFILEKLQKFLESKGYQVEMGWSKEHIEKRIRQMEPPPLALIVQYWEQLEVWNAEDIVLDLRLELAMRKVPIIVFCLGGLMFDVKRQIPGVPVIGHRESTDLQELVMRHLERIESDRGNK